MKKSQVKALLATKQQVQGHYQKQNQNPIQRPQSNLNKPHDLQLYGCLLKTLTHQTPPTPANLQSSIFNLRHTISASKSQNMSDEEHQFESKADAGASKTFPQQAGTIRKNGYIVIKNRACKVVEVSTSKTGKHGHAKCHFVAIDIFNGKKLEDIVPSSHNCDVPHVNRTDYQLIDISEDGFVSLLTESGGTKDDLKLPTDDSLLTQIKDGFNEGKDLVVTVMSAMGEEQICALKDIGPK
ncbi:putative ribosomal protein L2, domain 2 [Helianthus annuus]|uniref:Putative translation elongation factor IF5A n=2 Tax=Helianthus annuus TaxID=4232 RepID=A0A251U1R5_HELAN|nr:putative ribosomal protein L2, domain 2 [Helianthus annuus]KAJ0537599.1 putative ribosomal protein L2, domain 2 [Helianthus annuus]KAJ0545187.1 putative ribosomal protein L2, domain 2 [Helianthus annuus]KAJ0552180.1 putative ribosomal protein L2, domain 2 [Helianthus annuus]KAJ0717884.1 putative ribosomal protein L2, domain 2 [Helianthus annuus]